jgi:hypothetical protein
VDRVTPIFVLGQPAGRWVGGQWTGSPPVFVLGRPAGGWVGGQWTGVGGSLSAPPGRWRVGGWVWWSL